MSIHQKLAKIQSELFVPKGKENKFGGYAYRSCEDILKVVKPLCFDNGCSVFITNEMITVGAKVYCEATVTLTDWETGESVVAKAQAREAESRKGMDDSQVTGTASSYARKYALNGLFNIDDTKDADTDAYKKQTTTNTTAAPEYKCGDCGKPFEAFRDHTSGKTFTPAEVFQMAKKRNADGVARCADCRKKKGGA